jgi:hypothetical protein
VCVFGWQRAAAVDYAEPAGIGGDGDANVKKGASCVIIHVSC